MTNPIRPELMPKHSARYRKLTKACRGLENSDAALKHLGTAIAKKPSDVDAWLLLAELHKGRYDYDEALTCLDQVIAFGRDHAAEAWSIKAQIPKMYG